MEMHQGRISEALSVYQLAHLANWFYERETFKRCVETAAK